MSKTLTSGNLLTWFAVPYDCTLQLSERPRIFSITNEPDRAIRMLMMTSGLRLSEAARLVWRDIEIEEAGPPFGDVTCLVQNRRRGRGTEIAAFLST